MRRLSPFLLLLFFLVVALGLSMALGPVVIPLADVWQVLVCWFTRRPFPQELQTFATILLVIRAPRTALTALTGAALGSSGAAYQGLFRNPLADPYLIGVASGAGLGAVLAMSMRWPYTVWGLLTVPAAAFLGALVAVLLVCALARVGTTIPTTSLILAGVAISSFASALTSFLMLRSTGELHRAIGWLMGGSAQAGWQPVLILLPYLIPGLAVLLLSGHALNLLQFGDEQAQQMGLAVTRARLIVLFSASLATAAAVAFSGIIGFVGLIVPHLIRLWFGADYRRLLPLAMLGGMTALLLADVLARLLMAPQELPVGVITALFGAPFFLWVLRRAKHQGYW